MFHRPHQLLLTVQRLRCQNNTLKEAKKLRRTAEFGLIISGFVVVPVSWFSLIIGNKHITISADQEDKTTDDVSVNQALVWSADEEEEEETTLDLQLCSLWSTLLFMPLSFVPVAAERCSDVCRPPEGSSELQSCSPHCPAASTGDGVSESGGMFLFVLQPQRQEGTTRTKCWVIYFVVVDVFVVIFSRCRQCSSHILKTYNRLKKWNKSEAWTKYLITDVVVVVLTVFLHPYAGVLWLIGAAGARSVFLCLITCFLFESESIYTELQARGRKLCEKWQELSAQCHLVGELSSYQLKSFSVISL